MHVVFQLLFGSHIGFVSSRAVPETSPTLACYTSPTATTSNSIPVLVGPVTTQLP